MVPGISVGKILIQRDEESEEKLPKMFYEKYPPNISSKSILLCDPMLATGGSAAMGTFNIFKSKVFCSKMLGTIICYGKITILIFSNKITFGERCKRRENSICERYRLSRGD